ncbi:hypothetical protein DFH06DRAFT_1198572 [Mycena polygramma]|nr:hypothetical protein DFH06DRAFT_1198572 [Mycena polygramma]
MAGLLASKAMGPEALKAPEAWNAAWEGLFCHPQVTAPPHIFKCKLAEWARMPGVEARMLGEQETNRRGLCGLQFDVTRECITHFSTFEMNWMTATPVARRKHILGGLSQVCATAVNLNEARASCASELRLGRLSSDGKIFLDLLKSVLLEDVSFVPNTPIYVSDPEWDKLSAGHQLLINNVERLALAHLLLMRTKLICHVLHFTMRSFLRLELPSLFVEKIPKMAAPLDMSEARKFEKMAAERALGRDGAKAWRNDTKQFAKDRRADRRRFCSYPNCHEFEPLDGSVKFSRCRPCAEKAKREVLYCSTQCQKNDWKPRHKATCGKPLDFETISRAIPHPTELSLRDAAERIGPPVAAYKRPLALVAQVSWLNLNPAFNYNLNTVDDQEWHVRCDPTTSFFFRLFRDNAMTEGTIHAIGVVTHFLCWYAIVQNVEGITSAGIVSQLAREFEMDVELLKKHVLILEDMQKEDPQQRPLLLKEMPDNAWAGLYGHVDPGQIIITLE